ncbi:xanthine dehydrogenase family protein molybdopterin-binding subunit [Limibaculum sp. FT325]|uniref:xanthine dehydrogenase family protein molybdopterin-binding subunit n=1 Tax=Thermohalobaculum sediminis TaxID=2939436 RepID=UPI0020BD4C93|nr:xanthine dehydrogenase family protein molybdopterin-binding subunit [Limibaculum sediminis]MCL5778018.1 xanthine dehydrogenase family protein molybdopterin-binding subunit [Limibaculum sediminis]
MKFGIGQPVRRLEDTRLLTGKGSYVDDLNLPSQLHAFVLRSQVAYGRITRIDISSVREAPGVMLAWTHAEIAGRLAPLANEFPLSPTPAPVVLPHLAEGMVRFVGQPIAFVVAESRAAAEDAAELAEIELDELPVVVDPDEALAPGAPQLHAEAPGNLAYTWSCGDAEATAEAFARARHIVSTPVLNQRIVVNSLEPRAINVRHDAETGRWEAWLGSQGAHGMRAKVARALGVAADRVRVHVGDVGGAFGMKLMDHPEYGLCALAAADLGRPVKWIGSRSESFLSDAQGRDMRGTVEGAFDADGRCLAMRMRTVSGLGAYYSSYGAGVHTAFSAALLGGMYDVGAIHAEVRGAFLNTPPTDAYRGAGRPETIYATERLMEAAARQLGIDRVELRRRNLLTPDRVPHRSAGGFVFDSLDTHTVLSRATEAADYDTFEARAAEARMRGRCRGIGVAYYFERTGGQPSENARMELDASGVLRIWVGTQSSGQGHETSWAQIAHERLGLPLDAIRVMPGDSDALPSGGGTGGSRSLIMASQALIAGSDDLVDKAREMAADRLEASAADLEFLPGEGGVFRVAGTDLSVSLAELAAGSDGIAAAGQVKVESSSTFPNGAHVCEVEIDTETGALEILRYTIVDDFGRLVNPALVAGQVHGGIVQGIGQVIGEEARWDPETGQPLNGSFMDYCLPRAADVPMFDLAFEEVPARTNPLGVKGCGESGSVGGIPASALAVLDALWRAGYREPLETPYTPLKLWQALQTAARRTAA